MPDTFRIPLPHLPGKKGVFPRHARGFRVGHLIVGRQELDRIVLEPMVVKGLDFWFNRHESASNSRTSAYGAYIEWRHAYAGVVCFLVRTKSGWRPSLGVTPEAASWLPTAELAFDRWLAHRKAIWDAAALRHRAFEAHWGFGCPGLSPI